MAKPQISEETITKSLNALLKWIRSQSKSKSTITSTTATNNLSIYLILTLKKIPHCGRSLSFSVPIPHPIHSPISLIFDDRPNSPLTLPSIQNTIQSLSLPSISLIPVSGIRVHGQIPDGLLFVDHRLKKLLPKTNTKDGRKREVVEVDLRKKRWVEELRIHVSSTSLNFRGGTCCGIRVGRVGMPREEIAENVVAAVEGAVEKVPKRWVNVRAFHLKAAESLALPIYESTVDGGMKKKAEWVEGESEAKRSKVAAE